MLKLSDIKKQYKTGDTIVDALKGINVEFRKNEFVSILGQSGCGKTTLLNIIGGLDQYTSGDLVIRGTSTKEYKNSDWDAYRNNSIGFVFQSYNLISHQTVLANVELTMTLSGISKAERKRRATEALEKVGLGDQLHKKPNQMSGGQMQRVAIARALVNNPDIILADEPTGALDTETSVQIMELLKEVAKDKLVIMVTHNPQLAEQYSTRIIRLLDGKVVDDSMPYDSKDDEDVKAPRMKKKSMSYFTATSLSLTNLMTKKGRTILTAFAGAIGIIGIALILALSTGVQEYIDNVERDTLNSYPLTINAEAVDLTEMMSSMRGTHSGETVDHVEQVDENQLMTTMITSLTNNKTKNDLKAFKSYLESNDTISKYTASIEYKYSTPLYAYNTTGVDGLTQVNPSTVMEKMGMGSTSNMMSSMLGSSYDIWDQLPSENSMVSSMYHLTDGRYPENYNEVLLITDASGKISDYTLYSLGLRSQDDLGDMMKDAMNGDTLTENDPETYQFSDLEKLTYTVLPTTAFYEEQEDGTWVDQSENEAFMLTQMGKYGIDVKIVGVAIATENAGSVIGMYGGIGYTSNLMEELIQDVNSSDIVKQQKEHSDTDVFTGIEFPTEDEKEAEPTMEDLQAYIASLPTDQQATVGGMVASMQAEGQSEEEILAQFADYLKAATTDATYDGNLSLLGVASIDTPSSILLYPTDFEAKEKIVTELDHYSESLDEGEELKYTDYVGLMISSITTIINAITYILIGFVGISLVVSSIMIGIITYISVLERTKEIGILRAIGASKHDISRVFNAETIMIGFISGVIGIGIPLLISIPVNAAVLSAFDIANIMVLPWQAAVVLVIISMFLTFIGGLIPAKMAARKDPVEALRTE